MCSNETYYGAYTQYTQVFVGHEDIFVDKLKKPASWLCGTFMLACATLLSACHEEELTIDNTRAREHAERHRWDFCPNLDRAAIGGQLLLFPPPETGEVLSGFTTRYSPGALPLPCNTFDQSKFQGIFNFNVWPNLRGSNPSPERFRSALLQLVDFRPAAGSINVMDEPGGGFGVGVLSGTRHTCRFKVMRVDTGWAPANAGPDNLLPMSELASRPRAIEVSNTGLVRPWQINVSQEVGSWYNEGGEHGFAVIPDDPGYGAHKNNQCVGYFRFRLRTFLGEDTPVKP
jgi:hypothetical protein